MAHWSVTVRAASVLATLCATWATAAQEPAKPTSASATPGAATPAPASDLAGELKALEQQADSLLEQIKQYEGDPVETSALNRARMSLATTLGQRAILLLQLDGPDAFNQSAELLRQSEAINMTIDGSVLTADDQRIYRDLQVLSRRAIAAQVDYLRKRLPTAPPAYVPAAQPVRTYAPAAQPVRTYAPAAQPVCTYAPAAKRYGHRPLFNWFSPR